MANTPGFFDQPTQSYSPGLEPPGFDLLRDFLMRRIFQMGQNPYGLSQQGMQGMGNQPLFTTGNRPQASLGYMGMGGGMQEGGFPTSSPQAQGAAGQLGQFWNDMSAAKRQTPVMANQGAPRMQPQVVHRDGLAPVNGRPMGALRTSPSNAGGQRPISYDGASDQSFWNTVLPNMPSNWQSMSNHQLATSRPGTNYSPVAGLTGQPFNATGGTQLQDLLSKYGVNITYGANGVPQASYQGGSPADLYKGTMVDAFVGKNSLPFDLRRVLSSALQFGTGAAQQGLNPATATQDQVNTSYAAHKGYGSYGDMQAAGQAANAQIASQPRNAQGQAATGVNPDGSPKYGWGGSAGPAYVPKIATSVTVPGAPAPAPPAPAAPAPRAAAPRPVAPPMPPGSTTVTR